MVCFTVVCSLFLPQVTLAGQCWLLASQGGGAPNDIYNSAESARSAYCTYYEQSYLKKNKNWIYEIVDCYFSNSSPDAKGKYDIFYEERMTHKLTNEQITREYTLGVNVYPDLGNLTCNDPEPAPPQEPPATPQPPTPQNFTTATPKENGPPNCSTGGTGVGNPINPATGNKYQHEIDYVGLGINPLRFERHYNSLDADNQPLSRPTGLGAKWRHNYSAQIFQEGNIAHAIRANGKIHRFNQQSDGRWAADADVSHTLQQTSDGWTYHADNDQTEHYNSQGQLQTLTNRAGDTTTLHYQNNKLISVDNGYGRRLTIDFDNLANITRVTTPGGLQINYSYLTRYNLAGKALNKVTYSHPDETASSTREYRYQGMTTYNDHLQRPPLRHLWPAHHPYR